MKLMCGDCLELMKEIPDGSVDMILTDPPYGTTACKWDSVIPFEPMWEQLKRIIKPNGAIVMTASQPFTSRLVMSNPAWFRYSWVWEKDQGTNFLSAKRHPLKVHEDVLVFYVDLATQRGAAKEYQPVRRYLQDEQKATGLSSEGVRRLLGNCMASHYFTNGVQFCIPSEENYRKLQKSGRFAMPYAELKAWYDALGESVRAVPYNPQMVAGSPYTSGKGSSGEVTGSVKKTQTKNEGTRYPRSVIKMKRETGHHPTQKPVALMEYLIKTYTNEGDTVLDFTMGSGSTGVACVNTNRDFIGIELDEGYFTIAEKRIKEAQSQGGLF
jgi:site-specific DNA-methyltransferase (adenine-specific)